ncbi:MAG: cbb3-type cytochrome c oxidase subunit 3 [Planctomycetes bacterium]|nr:cbb3-type cytochrome c oxidase subunit 3 [Planctomycetota bacterium]
MSATSLLLADGVAITKQIVLVFFVILFVAIVVRLILSKSRRYDDTARIPLEDDVVTPRDQPVETPAHGSHVND